jgi:hypothetical protein
MCKITWKIFSEFNLDLILETMVIKRVLKVLSKYQNKSPQFLFPFDIFLVHKYAINYKICKC